MTSIPMTTDYVDVKVKIGAVEFTNEELQIDSIKISNGCYDGSVFGIGNVYIKNANITMNYRDGITKGLSMEIFFEYQGAWISFGKFVVTETPAMSGDKISVSLESTLAQYANTEIVFAEAKPSYNFDTIIKKIEEITGKVVVFKSELDSTGTEKSEFLSKTANFIKDAKTLMDPASGCKTGISVRTALAGIAILFGGNVYEDTNNKIVIKQKTYSLNSDRYILPDYLDGNYKYSKEVYAIKTISLLFNKYVLDIYYRKETDPPGSDIWTQNYLDEDKVSNTLLASQSSMIGKTPYDYTVTCDWIGWTSDGFGYNLNETPGGRASACLRQGDLMYRTCDMTFVGIDFGWNIAPGNLIKVKVPELENPIDVLCGEISYEWDGGFTTNISCNCNIESNGSYSTEVSTQASAAAAQEGRQTSLELNYANITFSNIEDSTIRGSIFKDGTIDGSKIKDSTITGSLIANSTIKGSNIEEGTITGSKIKAATITGALIVDGTIRGNHIMESSIDGSNIKDSAITESKISNSSITNSKIKDGEIENSKIKDATLTGSKIENSTLTNDLFKDGTIENSKIKDGTIENSKIKDATLTGAKIQDATIGFEKVNVSFIKDLTADKAYIENLKASIADFGYLTADTADIAYAKIDFSNVGTQVVGSSMIIDGAVTNEKVANLSANKITSGTIDAKKVTVSNLNASNINTGTLTVGGVTLNIKENKAEIDGSDIKDGTVTLEGLSTEVKDVIDGAIETFTKSEIPTLNNEPASLWTDNETRKKHIGDVCYVLNPASSADGYCYRFANTGTEAIPSYEWVLIKDSDVTKALQDIIDINGEITGIKQFDTEISSWKTDTDNELSSLKSRTTSLETDMGTKVSSTTFNSLKQTVDENSSNITSLSETVSKKADGSTVTALSNTVNSVKQTTDSNTQSISNLTTEVNKKADGSTVTSLTNRVSTVEQNLDGFKTTVSSTYTTKEEFNDLEIGGRNLLVGTKDFNITNAVILKNQSQILSEKYDSLTIRYRNKAWNFYDISISLKAGTYTFSAYVKGSCDLVQIGVNCGEYKYINYAISSDWKRISLTFYVKEDMDVNLACASVHDGDFYSCGWKLENGNKPTPWTPAIEDTEAEIQDVDKKVITNLLKPTLATTTQNGVTCTNNGDGTYTLNGTSSAKIDFVLFGDWESTNTLVSGGTYNVLFNDSIIDGLELITAFNTTRLNNTGTSSIVNAPNGISYVIIRVYSGTTLNNKIVKPMITTNLNATYDDFVPYTGSTGKINSDVANNHKLTETAKTIAEQTADKFSWLVKSGTSSTDFTLTDRVASLLSEQFNIDALTTFKNSAENGTSTVINGGAIDTDSLFAQDITATGTITGATLKGTTIYSEIGKIAGFTLKDQTLVSEFTQTDISNSVWDFKNEINSKANSEKHFITATRTGHETGLIANKACFGIDGVLLDSFNHADDYYDKFMHLSDRILAFGVNSATPYNGRSIAFEIDSGYAPIYGSGEFTINPSCVINVPTTVNNNLTVTGTLNTYKAEVTEGIEIYHPSSTPYIDFHNSPYGQGSSDYDFRIILHDENMLSFENYYGSIFRIHGALVYENGYSLIGCTITKSGNFTCKKYRDGRLIIEFRFKTTSNVSLSEKSETYYAAGPAATFPIEFTDVPSVISGLGIANSQAPFCNVTFDSVTKTGFGRYIIWTLPTISGYVVPSGSVVSATFTGRWK